MRRRTVFLVNFRNLGELYPPFGIMYLADALEQAGYQAELFHETDEHISELVARVVGARPLFVGFSTITGPQLRPTLEASRRIHSLGVPVVWGGVHATIMPTAVLREPAVDLVVVNEGEETIQEVARIFAGEHRRHWHEVAGVAFRDDHGTAQTGRRRPFITDLDRFSPRWEKLPLERYLIPSGPFTRAIPVPISRGCPFRCGFCYNDVVMRRSWRQHSAEHVVAQTEWLRSAVGIDAVDYADDYLFGRIQPMQQLVEQVGMPWSGQVRVQLLSEEFVRWMRDTGCQWVNIGAESGSQAVLDSIAKDQQAWHIEWGVDNLVRGAPDIEANLSFMVGLPDESDHDRGLTFDLMERLVAKSRNVRCSLCVYMPYPGTPLWQRAVDRGFLEPHDQEGWCNFDLDRANTPWMDDSEARAMCDIAAILFVGRSRGHWLLAPYYALLRWRWRHRRFRHYWEGAVKRALLRSPLAGMVRSIIRRLVDFNPVTHKGPTERMPRTRPPTPEAAARREDRA
jgi:radical SAM superfamily enzyme YgiQ (UPF0313 family)